MINAMKLFAISEAFDELLDCAELNQDDLEPETVAAIENASRANKEFLVIVGLLAALQGAQAQAAVTEQKLKELNAL